MLDELILKRRARSGHDYSEICIDYLANNFVKQTDLLEKIRKEEIEENYREKAMNYKSGLPYGIEEDYLIYFPLLEVEENEDKIFNPLDNCSKCTNDTSLLPCPYKKMHEDQLNKKTDLINNLECEKCNPYIEYCRKHLNKKIRDISRINIKQVEKIIKEYGACEYNKNDSQFNARYDCGLCEYISYAKEILRTIEFTKLIKTIDKANAEIMKKGTFKKLKRVLLEIENSISNYIIEVDEKVIVEERNIKFVNFLIGLKRQVEGMIDFLKSDDMKKIVERLMPAINQN